MYRGALRSVLSELLRQDRLLLTQDFGVSAAKVIVPLLSVSSGRLTSGLDEVSVTVTFGNDGHVKSATIAEPQPRSRSCAPGWDRR